MLIKNILTYLYFIFRIFRDWPIQVNNVIKNSSLVVLRDLITKSWFCNCNRALYGASKNKFAVLMHKILLNMELLYFLLSYHLMGNSTVEFYYLSYSGFL